MTAGRRLPPRRPQSPEEDSSASSSRNCGSTAAVVGRKPVIAVLTLERHQTGVWIAELVERLRRRRRRHYGCRGLVTTTIGDDETGPSGAVGVDVDVDVVTLESLDLDRYHCSGPQPWSLLVNRVSDAADPVLAKSCQSVLNTANLWDIPCFNGPRAYSIGTNKTLHHHVFAKAGCRTPRSVKVRFGPSAGGGLGGEKLLSAARMLVEDGGCGWPLLLKPNSAGFGEGIRLFAGWDDLVAYADGLSSSTSSSDDDNDTDGDLRGPSEDGVALLQEYVEPRDGSIYRVWFLNGGVQCAVQRSVRGMNGAANSNDGRRTTTTPQEDAANDFTSGCTGGSCSLSDRRRDQKESEGERRKMKMKKQSEQVHVTSSDFTSGCAGGTCSLTRNHGSGDEEKGKHDEPRFRAWTVPDDVSNDIARVLAVVGDDCDAGSVELLYDGSGNRIYFDLNMLSTLPIVDDGSVAVDVDAGGSVWPEGYDPWSELADAVMDKVKLAY